MTHSIMNELSGIRDGNHHSYLVVFEVSKSDRLTVEVQVNILLLLDSLKLTSSARSRALELLLGPEHNNS